ncbi:MAG TPA: PepSY-like domain-containing protein [Flavobacteriales bacterium]|nr:PepSY-like domain-containing protein [Flavobacteriales bacterium]HRP82823.1 PepSY-like domain-containing protein [Flavobacteriales bacterium]HRQ85780.1 PepSY-like domain-containing protein [Flavobacteriales bacterium]
MKTPSILSAAFAAVALLAGTALHAQKLTAAQLPAPVTTAFAKAFPKAMDIEWKQKGEQYKVEFETGLFRNDHEAWFDATGKLLRHEEEVSASDLPEAVKAAIAKDFPDFRTDDVKRIEAEGATTWIVELQNGPTEWKVAYDAAGKQLQKQAD